jgi:dephospho-CoA kinase
MQSDDPNKQNIGKCIEQADQVFMNNSSVEMLFSQVEKSLKGYHL